MTGDASTANVQVIQSLLRLVRDVAWTSAIGFKGAALKTARRLLQSAGGFDQIISSEREAMGSTFQFRSVTCELEQALSNFPYGDYEISEDIKEQVDLVRAQLIRAAQRYKTNNIHHHGVKSTVKVPTIRN
ncbi:hypothetical protein L1887_30701 [Cichorium endivia]|nr:hypothetical protein L1887_30701 [Cichorium endivia]